MEHQIISYIQEKFDPAKKYIGRDTALVNGAGSFHYSTDMLIEDVHFDSSYSPEDIAYKLFTVNISDMSAVAVAPEFMALNMAFPKTIEFEWVKRFLDELFSLSEKYNVQLVGGDTSSSPGPKFFSLSIWGAVNPKFDGQSSSQVNDEIWVLGTLGAANASLRPNLGLDTQALNECTQVLKRPTVYSEAILWLVDQINITAMTDVSDGLCADVRPLARGGIIEVKDLPVHPALKKLSLQERLELALIGGEDYALAFTCVNVDSKILNEFNQMFNLSLVKIGIVEGESWRFQLDGKKIDPDSLVNYSHF